MFQSFPDYQPGTIKYLRKCTIRMDLNAQVIIWYMVTRKSKILLHFCFDLYFLPVHCFCIMMFLQTVIKSNIIRRLCNDLPKVTNETTIQSKSFSWICAS